jgi:hypothetical protein
VHGSLAQLNMGAKEAQAGPRLSRRQNQSPNAAMRPVGALALHSRVGPCSRTEREHHHPFLAASRSGRGFTAADFLVRISGGYLQIAVEPVSLWSRRHRAVSLAASVVTEGLPPLHCRVLLAGDHLERVH